MVNYRRHPALELLEQTYPLGNLTLDTIEGLRWQNRMQASDAYFKDYSGRFGWRDNLKLLSGFGQMMKEFGTYVSLPYAIGQNWVADTYYRNPDPLIQDKGGNRDLGKILSDVMKSVHQEVDSERKMKEALGDQFWAGFGCVFASFVQKADEDPEQIDLNTGGPALVPTEQKILFRRLSPWRMRWDPEGRDWDLSDHSYVALDYSRTLAQLMRDPRLVEDDRRRLMAFYTRREYQNTYDAQQVRYATLTSFQEEDPEYIRVPIRHIWARPDKKIYDQPLGASFTFAPQDWPEEFAEADLFPVRYIAKNKEAEDESGLCGFIGVPDLTMIRPHIVSIMKLEWLFLVANMHVINKYLMPKGALGDTEKTRLADGVKQFSVIEWDPAALNAFPAEMRNNLGPKDILTLVPQAELKDLRHLEGIRHELDMIAQIIGQGGADRGGLSDAETATESLGMQQGLQRRRSNAIQVNGKHYNAVTKLFFIILKARQTLPIRYQMTTARFNERVWAEFNADALLDLDLHFDYATGSSEPRTREEEFALRERMAAVLLPTLTTLGDKRAMMKVAHDLVEVLNIEGSEQFFNDVLIDLVKQLLAIIRGLGKGNIAADNIMVAQKIPELIAQIAGEVLTQQDIAEVEAASANAPAPEPEGQGSVAAAPTPGAADYAAGARGSAAAGMGGGMAN